MSRSRKRLDPHQPITPEDTQIFRYLDLPHCPNNTNFPTKHNFITEVVNPAITGCSRIGTLWDHVLQEPLTLGYITWNAMLILIAALGVHDRESPRHACIRKEKLHTFIKECLLLCSTIHFPPLPGGADDCKPFYAASKVSLGVYYSHFEEHIFKPLDEQTGHRVFDPIRETPGLMSSDMVSEHGRKVYYHLLSLKAGPEALHFPRAHIPSGI